MNDILLYHCWIMWLLRYNAFIISYISIIPTILKLRLFSKLRCLQESISSKGVDFIHITILRSSQNYKQAFVALANVIDVESKISVFPWYHKMTIGLYISDFLIISWLTRYNLFWINQRLWKFQGRNKILDWRGWNTSCW